MNETPPYVAMIETRACAACETGETWGVRGPGKVWTAETFYGEEAQISAEESAGALNHAFELGRGADDETAAQALRECMEQCYHVVIETVDALRIVKIMREAKPKS